MDSYQDIPYESGPFAETHPVNLAVQGRLFGLESPDPDDARVLELGCASGGNLIPMAFHLPRTRFLGIELSTAQAQAGARFIEELALDNVCIEQGDVLAPGRDIGTFDYIIAHGLYSWVPAPVREAILALCTRHLSPRGIAYISFNTLPGWRMRGMLRDMLLHHVRSIPAPAARLAAAQEFLATFGKALDGLDALHAQYLRLELERIRRNHPSYLYHEYLEEVNEPLLFSEFVTQAARHGLDYLCDADLQMMFAGDLEPAAGEWLAGIEDRIEREQRADFVRNRAFRGTLLCRAGQARAGEPDFRQFDRLAFHALLAPQNAPAWRNVEAQAFVAPGGETHDVSHPLTKSALQHLASVFPDSVAAGTLAAEAQRILTATGNREHATETEHMLAELASLYIRRAVGADVHARRVHHELTPRPRATRLARLQATRQIGHLTTPRHTIIPLDDFAARLVAALDGTRTVEELVQHMATAGATGPARDTCVQLLVLLARQGLLEAPNG